MTAIPSGMPTPTPSAVVEVAECSGVWTGTGGSVFVLAGEDAGAIVAFESLVPEGKMVVTGGNPSSMADVGSKKLALTPD